MIKVGIYDKYGKRTAIKEFPDFNTDFWHLNHACTQNNIEIRICCNATPPKKIEIEDKYARQK